MLTLLRKNEIIQKMRVNKLPHLDSELSELQLKENYDFFIEYLKSVFSGERLEKLLELYDMKNFGNALMVAPASGTLHYHNAHIGGYLQHVMNVTYASEYVEKIMLGLSSVSADYTTEERIMAALHHDLGKLGKKGESYYIREQEQWAIKRGKVFKHNPNIQLWDVPDYALFILQENKITITEKETLGIKMSDGLYSDKNKFYLMQSSDEGSLRTMLPHIIHWADNMSARGEYCEWKMKMESILS